MIEKLKAREWAPRAFRKCGTKPARKGPHVTSDIARPAIPHKPSPELDAEALAQEIEKFLDELVAGEPSKSQPARRKQSKRPWSLKHRRTKSAITAIRDEIRGILEPDNPMTVRQVFYQLVVRALIEKTEKAYKNIVIRLLTRMRLSGDIPFSWIIDDSRRTRETQTFNSITDALKNTAQFYRRSALRESDVYIEIWSEKEALSGIIWDVASDYDVPVVVSKGSASLTQVFNSFLNIQNAARAGKQAYIYQFGDHDPSGVVAWKAIERRLNEFCDKHDCLRPIVERIALTPEQIREYRLPSRPTKRKDNTHAKNFKGRSTELDALPASALRQLVRACIERHIFPTQLETLRAAEESERTIIQRLAQQATEEF